MRKALKWLGVGLIVILVLGAYPAYRFSQEIAKASSEDPAVWEDDIVALEEATRARGALKDPVLFIGSSSIRFWTSLAEDMAPLVTIRHGFGGSKLGDIVDLRRRHTKLLLHILALKQCERASAKTTTSHASTDSAARSALHSATLPTPLSTTLSLNAIT